VILRRCTLWRCQNNRSVDAGTCCTVLTGPRSVRTSLPSTMPIRGESHAKRESRRRTERANTRNGPSPPKIMKDVRSADDLFQHCKQLLDLLNWQRESRAFHTSVAILKNIRVGPAHCNNIHLSRGATWKIALNGVGCRSCHVRSKLCAKAPVDSSMMAGSFRDNDMHIPTHRTFLDHVHSLD